MSSKKVYKILLHCYNKVDGSIVKPFEMTTKFPPGSDEKQKKKMRIKYQMMLDAYTKEGELELIIDKIEFVV